MSKLVRQRLKRMYGKVKAAVLPGPMWTMAGGTRIRVCDMDDKHLVNTINHIARRGNGYPDCDGDGKGNYTDPFADHYDFDPPTIYYDMVAEAKRRELDLTKPGYMQGRIARADEFPYVEA